MGDGRSPQGALVALLVIVALAAYLYDHSRRDVIANGVRIDGIAVGGLHEAAARAKLERDIVQRLSGPVVVHAAGSHVDAHRAQRRRHGRRQNMVQQAIDASREGSIVTRTWRSVFGGSVNRDIPLAASYSHESVRGLTARVRTEVNRPPQDANVEPGSSGLRKIPGKDGRTVENDKLGGRVEAALLAPLGSRTVAVPMKIVKPKVTTAQLAAKYPAYIVVDRGTFRLLFYSHLKLEKTYEVAVGMEGLETPAGLHHIEWEQVDPPWYVPKKAWAGALAGTVVPPGPADPLKARFMSIEGGAGIHGIDPSEYSSIGHDASHGCVRMRIPDVIALYSKTPVGTPVFII